MEKSEYIEDVESALIDVLGLEPKWNLIRALSILGPERIEEIKETHKIVVEKYKKRHNIE